MEQCLLIRKWKNYLISIHLLDWTHSVKRDVKYIYKYLDFHFEECNYGNLNTTAI